MKIGDYMKIMDLHSHTYFSNCGRDEPETIIDAAAEGGIELFGITDHNYGINEREVEYSRLINSMKEPYADRIKLLCGIEIATLPDYYNMKEEEYKLFDFCLIENVGWEGTITKDCFFEFMEKIPIKKGIAHTDLFAYAETIGMTPFDFFKKMADSGIFWEMNVSYDSIHNYREHPYMLEFFEDPKKQDIIRDAKVVISVGFDGHRVEDYLPPRIKEYCLKLGEMKLKTADELFK
ncbi:MAG: PHP domain-containing protein [Bacillota bacterium]|nr:PHP domain-containing protein [Bacillota bacterium]